MDLRDKWNARYKTLSGLPKAARVLHENRHLLPASGVALDVACGRGGNAIELARQGLQVDAIDLSTVAIDDLQAQARQEGLTIQATVSDIEHSPPEVDKYNVIVVSYFLSRPLFSALTAALKSGGLMYYQTFTRTRVSDRGPQNPEYRLANQELLILMPDFDLVVYREETDIGNISEGFRDEVMYIGRKKD